MLFFPLFVCHLLSRLTTYAIESNEDPPSVIGIDYQSGGKPDLNQAPSLTRLLSPRSNRMSVGSAASKTDSRMQADGVLASLSDRD